MMVKIADDNSIDVRIIAGIDQFTQLDNFINSVGTSTDNLSDNFMTVVRANANQKERPAGAEDVLLPTDPGRFRNQQFMLTLNLVLNDINDLDNLLSRVTNAITAVSELYDLDLIGSSVQSTGDVPEGAKTPFPGTK